MNDVARRRQETDLLVRGQHQRAVRFQRIVLALRFEVVDLPARTLRVAVVAEPGFDVLVVPLPLRAGDEHREIRIAVVLDLHQRGRRRDRHADEDEGRDQRPDHFEALVLVKVRRLGPPRAPMREDRIEHRAEDDDADDDAHREAQVMQRLDAPAHLGHAFAHVERGVAEARRTPTRGAQRAASGLPDEMSAECRRAAPRKRIAFPRSRRCSSRCSRLPGYARWHGKTRRSSWRRVSITVQRRNCATVRNWR